MSDRLYVLSHRMISILMNINNSHRTERRLDKVVLFVQHTLVLINDRRFIQLDTVMHVRVFNIHTYIHTYIHACIRTYAHKHIRTYIHTLVT